MPTGYTAGILDGEINDFKDFAKQCSRAFLMHLREEPLNSEYKKREPIEYHLKAISKAAKELEDIDRLTDQDLICIKKNALLIDKEYHLDRKKKAEDDAIKLDTFITKALTYNPPTDEHIGIKDFMIQQLTDTKKSDCNGQYHINQIASIEDKINNLNADSIRSGIRAQAADDIAYHNKEHELELERCKEQNKWYDTYINSLEEVTEEN